ncbi:dethiobiotin synthase [Lachnospiraceae bacterium LCP25S3_G4]
MNHGIFITGTGTDVGKTFISALIMKQLVTHNISAGYYKPALSGASLEGKMLIPGDAKYVCDVAQLSASPSTLVSYIFQTPVSPHLASELEGKEIELEQLYNDYCFHQQQHDFILVEGCGGIICPLRAGTTPLMLVDVIKRLELDIIIVASSELGTINSTLLTVSYARQHQLPIRGIILNHYNKYNFLHKDNKKQIEHLSGIPVLCCVGEQDTCINLNLQTLF